MTDINEPTGGMEPDKAEVSPLDRPHPDDYTTSQSIEDMVDDIFGPKDNVAMKEVDSIVEVNEYWDNLKESSKSLQIARYELESAQKEVLMADNRGASDEERKKLLDVVDFLDERFEILAELVENHGSDTPLSDLIVTVKTMIYEITETGKTEYLNGYATEENLRNILLFLEPLAISGGIELYYKQKDDFRDQLA